MRRSVSVPRVIISLSVPVTHPFGLRAVPVPLDAGELREEGGNVPHKNGQR